jgi:hypothetical protein
MRQCRVILNAARRHVPAIGDVWVIAVSFALFMGRLRLYNRHLRLLLIRTYLSDNLLREMCETDLATGHEVFLESPSTPVMLVPYNSRRWHHHHMVVFIFVLGGCDLSSVGCDLPLLVFDFVKTCFVLIYSWSLKGHDIFRTWYFQGSWGGDGNCNKPTQMLTGMSIESR